MTPRTDGDRLTPSTEASPAAPPRSLRGWMVRLAFPLVWRSPARMAGKLAEFGATEAGSALDMLRAAELTDDPRLRRLFFRHALDEAGHARLFREVARAVDPAGAAPLTDRARVHARRQDLFAALGAADFLAFVHRAEQGGEAHFRALVGALARTRPDLAALFEDVARDERFHVRYSARWLARVSDEPQQVLLRAGLSAAWATWKRAGRGVGERVATVFLLGVFLLVLPPFAIAQRLLDRERTGWHQPRPSRRNLAEQARRQAR